MARPSIELRKIAREHNAIIKYDVWFCIETRKFYSDYYVCTGDMVYIDREIANG